MHIALVILACADDKHGIHYLGRVVTKNLVHYNNLFTVGEPSLWSEPSFRLRWRWGHIEERGNTYGQRYQPSLAAIEPSNSYRVIAPLTLSRTTTCESM